MNPPAKFLDTLIRARRQTQRRPPWPSQLTMDDVTQNDMTIDEDDDGEISARDPWERFASMRDYLLASESDELVINGVRGAFRLGPTGVVAVSGKTWLPHSSGEFLDWLHRLADAARVRLDARYPGNGAPWPDGQGRWHGVIHPIAPEGPYFCLRRHRFSSLKTTSFAGFGSCRAVLEDAWAKGAPVLFAGPTGSGKSSLLSAWLAAVAYKQRLVILESMAELPLASDRWLRLCTRPPDLDGDGQLDCENLMGQMLRLRPEAVVVGELRTREVDLFVAASATGHGSVAATVHGTSKVDLTRRFPGLLQLNPLVVWLGRAPHDPAADVREKPRSARGDPKELRNGNGQEETKMPRVVGCEFL